MALMHPYMFRRKERFVVFQERVLEPYSKMPVGRYGECDRVKGHHA